MRITHPFHPLCSQTFDLISRSQHWGEDRVIYRASDGTLPTIASAFTDMSEPDAFQRVAAGRAAFRAGDLVGLLRLLDQVEERWGCDNA